ncbi:hypothetical protein LEP1GSC168_4026 [Leptospira santarosai str. HAI134]|nr:hypothetical protein LEP1GSC168_4026 [Leptospira santarosai str. HAI134]
MKSRNSSLLVRIAKIVFSEKSELLAFSSNSKNRFFEKSELLAPILKESFSQTAISYSKKERNFLADPKIRVF